MNGSFIGDRRTGVHANEFTWGGLYDPIPWESQAVGLKQYKTNIITENKIRMEQPDQNERLYY